MAVDRFLLQGWNKASEATRDRIASVLSLFEHHFVGGDVLLTSDVPVATVAATTGSTYTFQRLWSRKFQCQLTDVAVASGVFFPDGPMLSAKQKVRHNKLSTLRNETNGQGLLKNQVFVATDHGTIIAVSPKDSADDIIIETRGSSITTMLLRQLYPFSKCDIIVGDSEGSVVVMTRQRTLLRKSVGSPISCLCIREADDEFEIIVGDYEGNLTAFSNLEQSWKTQIGGSGAYFENSRHQPSISCLATANFSDENGNDATFLLVCDQTPRLFFVVDGQPIFWIPMPCRINAMCTGRFLPVMNATKPPHLQVILGGDDGNLYILDNYKLYKYASIDFEISCIIKWTVKPNNRDAVDLVCCGGHFDELHVFLVGELVISPSLHDWILKLSVGDMNGDGQEELVVVLADSTVEVYRFCSSKEDVQKSVAVSLPISGENARRQKIVDAILSATETGIDSNIVAGLEPMEYLEEEEGAIDDEEGQF